MKSSTAWLEMAMWKLWLGHKKIMNKSHYLLLCVFCLCLFSLLIISIGVSKKYLILVLTLTPSFSNFDLNIFLACLFVLYFWRMLSAFWWMLWLEDLMKQEWMMQCRETLTQPVGGVVSWRKSVNVTDSIFFFSSFFSFFLTFPSFHLRLQQKFVDSGFMKLMQAVCRAWNETCNATDLLSLNHFNTKEKNRL